MNFLLYVYMYLFLNKILGECKTSDINDLQHKAMQHHI
jgi:hypothetical protein